jgi:ribonuclease HI
MGLGCVIVVDGERVEICAGGDPGTNNHAELGAALLALSVLPPQCRVTIYADSQYLVFGITKWIGNWRRKDFKRNGDPIPNADLWLQLDAINSGRSIRWEWVRGHVGNRGNDLADRLATLGRRGGA